MYAIIYSETMPPLKGTHKGPCCVDFVLNTKGAFMAKLFYDQNRHKSVPIWSFLQPHSLPLPGTAPTQWV